MSDTTQHESRVHFTQPLPLVCHSCEAQQSAQQKYADDYKGQPPPGRLWRLPVKAAEPIPFSDTDQGDL